MKKTLLLLPVAALLLTGCDKAEKEDVNTQPTVAQLSDALVGSLANMYKSAVSGLSVNFELSNANIHIVNSSTEEDVEKQTTSTSKTDVEVKNLGFKVKLDVRNLNKAVKDWEAAIVVEDLQATETVILNDTTVVLQDKTFADIDFGVYLKSGNLYANLSDPELKSTALEVMDIVFGTSEIGTKFKAIVEQYAKDMYMENAIDMLGELLLPSDDEETPIPLPYVESAKKVKRNETGISDMVLIPSEIPAEYLLDIKQELPMILTQIIGPTSPLKNAFSFALKGNYLNKVEVNFKSTDLPAETFEGNDVTFNASLTANFDNSGLLTSVATNETFNATIIEDDNGITAINDQGETISLTTETETTHFEGSIAANATISYPTSAIVMPDFSGYELFVLPE